MIKSQQPIEYVRARVLIVRIIGALVFVLPVVAVFLMLYTEDNSPRYTSVPPALAIGVTLIAFAALCFVSGSLGPCILGFRVTGRDLSRYLCVRGGTHLTLHIEALGNYLVDFGL